ncbi:MAG: phosphohistidine phosphatase SixA [Chthoniobacterales bacterium]
MKLCFLRHGEADWPNWTKPDNERPLTERGRKEMKRVAKFLERLKLVPDVILTSPLPRASQTAEIVGQRLGIELQIEPALAHGFNIERLRRLLAKRDAECIMIVGHEPEFSEIIGELTGGKTKISKAGVALLEINRSGTSGTLLWHFPPKFAKAT